MLKIFAHLESERATIRFKQQFIKTIINPYEGIVHLTIDGLSQFSFFLRIKIGPDYFKLTILNNEIELHYVKNILNSSEKNTFWCFNHTEQSIINPPEELGLFMTRLEDFMKINS